MIRKVIAIVKEAGAIALKRDFTVQQKGCCENLVTSTDREVQKFLVRHLSDLIPGSGFICEEDDLITSEREYTWIVDPIDGTANYSRGIEEYGISVALVHMGEIVLGVVYNPSRGHLFRAQKGKGAYLGNKRIHVSSRTFRDGLFCTAMSVYRKSLAPVCNSIIMEAYMLCNDLRRFGACAVELCYLALGLCDLFFEIRVQPWDCAAATLILQEAGGAVSSLNGTPLRWDGPLLLAAANTQDNLNELNTIISKHIKSIPYAE